MRILVDMDGVLADFEGSFLQKWRAAHPDEFYMPLHERKSMYVTEEYPKRLRKKIWSIFTMPRFFLDLEPIPGGRQALETMRDHGHEVFICTAPLIDYENCVLEKHHWVATHLGRDWVQRVILTTDKTLVKGDILIDDKPHITGVEHPPLWEHVLYDQPYNRHVTDKRRLTWEDWHRVIAPAKAVLQNTP